MKRGSSGHERVPENPPLSASLPLWFEMVACSPGGTIGGDRTQRRRSLRSPSSDSAPSGSGANVPSVATAHNGDQKPRSGSASSSSQNEEMARVCEVHEEPEWLCTT